MPSTSPFPFRLFHPNDIVEFQTFLRFRYKTKPINPSAITSNYFAVRSDKVYVKSVTTSRNSFSRPNTKMHSFVFSFNLQHPFSLEKNYGTKWQRKVSQELNNFLFVEYYIFLEKCKFYVLLYDATRNGSNVAIVTPQCHFSGIFLILIIVPVGRQF